jgi:hypothetical protein
VTATDIEMVECDAQWIGSDREPSRATQDITPKVRRHVWHRDHGNCTVDGCRSARNIDVPHIVPRYLGGGHEAENLTLLCSGHHRSHHNGALQITGRAPDLAMTWTMPSHVGHDISTTSHAATRHGAPAYERNKAPSPSPTPHVGREVSFVSPASPAPHAGQVPSTATRPSTSKYERVVMKTEAIQALTTAAFERSTARALVEDALATASADISLESLLVIALQRSRNR